MYLSIQQFILNLFFSINGDSYLSFFGQNDYFVICTYYHVLRRQILKKVTFKISYFITWFITLNYIPLCRNEIQGILFCLTNPIVLKQSYLIDKFIFMKLRFHQKCLNLTIFYRNYFINILWRLEYTKTNPKGFLASKYMYM